jgi:penicillin V acylase-like amidase (Ntn superfamily)
MRRSIRKHPYWCIFILGLLAVAPPQFALACTRVLWNSNKLAVVVGRTMDWPESTQPILTVFPKGMERDGSRIGSQVVVADNAARWTSKYGSVVTTVYGVGTADGVNEKGFAIHMLYPILVHVTKRSLGCTQVCGDNISWTMQAQ